MAPAASPGILKTQPAAVIGIAVALVDAVLASGIGLSPTVRSILIAAVTVAGAFGIRSQVRPVATSVPR